MSKPNILVIFTDDQRFDTVHALGNRNISTPNIDRLVQNGTSFNNAYIMGGTETAVCMPSRAMLMTGRTLFHLENSGEHIPEDHIMLGETLGRAGYHCWGTGKWHNGTESYTRCFQDGADIYFGGGYDHWMVPVHSHDPSGTYPGRISKDMIPVHQYEPIDTYTERVQTYRVPALVEEKIADHVHAGEHSSNLFASQAADFILNYEKEDPFFCYIAFMAPHDPRTTPQEFYDMYPPEKIEIEENFMSQHPFDNGELDARDELLVAIPREEFEVKCHIAEYYAMVSHLDSQLGVILDALKASDQIDKTIIVFAGDNGIALGRHGLFGKQNLYDHSVHIPMIFCGPGIPNNAVRESLVYTTDIYPTICDMINIDIPQSVLGKSMTSVIKENEKGPRDYLYHAYKDIQRAVTYQGWKLIEYNVKGVRSTQLFNLTTDPNELSDLFGHPSYSENIDVMRNKMFQARREFEDYLEPFAKFWEGF